MGTLSFLVFRGLDPRTNLPVMRRIAGVWSSLGLVGL